MKRPSYREIDQKLKQAREAAAKNLISIVNPMSFASDALDLRFSAEDITNILIDILEEITAKNYVGQYPPQRFYEDRILDYELYPFRWNSKVFGCKAYLKFAIKDGPLSLVSLHEDRG
jgi:hypothetical protein